MDKFEYMVTEAVSIRGSDSHSIFAAEDQMNSLGDEGWELVSTSICPGSSIPVIFCFWKRQK